MAYVVTHPVFLDSKVASTAGVLVTLSPTCSAANPTVCTSVGHGLVSNETVRFTESTTTPTVNGDHVVTVTGANTFTVPVSVSGAGSATVMRTTFVFTDFVRATTHLLNMSTGEYVALFTANNLTFRCPGDHTGSVVLGRPYPMTFILSPPFLRDERGTADTQAELGIERVLISHKDSIEYNVVVATTNNRALTVSHYNEAGVGSFGLNVFGSTQVFVMSNAEDTSISIINNSPRPSTITAVRMECNALERPR